jgi:hypothetical protein
MKSMFDSKIFIFVGLVIRADSAWISRDMDFVRVLAVVAP